MAHWISSKLKAAETLLQQIDQQAADSLGKNERPRAGDEFGVESSSGAVSEIKPLIKDQLKKKASEYADNQSSNNNTERSNPNAISRSNSDITRNDNVGSSINLNSKMKSRGEVTDSDWTELLSAPDKRVASQGVSVSQSRNGALGVLGGKKNSKKGRNFGPGMSSLVVDGKSETGRSYKELRSSKKLHVDEITKGGDEAQTLSYQLLSTGGRGPSDQRDTISNITIDNINERTNEGLNIIVDGLKEQSTANSSNEVHMLEMLPVSHKAKSDLNLRLVDDGASKSEKSGKNESMMVPSPPSDDERDSETDSTSTSDSEEEREKEERRMKRQQLLAERAAAKALEAIQERENLVAKLEGEKHSLEKILEEQAKQQVLEASELQTSMMEIMEAAEMEKQKHNITRREALARLAELESENADLAKSLASIQKNLELEVDGLAEIRQQVDSREATLEELQRKIMNVQSNGEKLLHSKGVELATEMLEAEYSFITDKMERLQEKAKTLESSIEITRKEMEYPTEVEVVLKQRLSLLTDHLIQKQAQVETLSSEKATLIFRIEAVSKLLEESKQMSNSSDSPSAYDLSDSKISPLFKDRVKSGQRHFGSLVRQLDSIFCSGAVFLRRNSTARIWALVYIVCLHLWVIYILTSHSSATEEIKSGAAVSLENINYTGSGA